MKYHNITLQSPFTPLNLGWFVTQQSVTVTDLLSVAEMESKPEELWGMAVTHVGPHCHTICCLAEGQVTPQALTREGQPGILQM